MHELRTILFKKMHRGKSPGSDGLTVGLYQAVFKSIKDTLLECLREGKHEEELSQTQKLSVIKLIQKQGQNRPKALTVISWDLTI